MGGDGIGPEVIKAGLQALEVCAERDGGFRFEVEHFDWGSDYYKKHGVMMPEGGADQLRKFDAIYFGAVGAPDAHPARHHEPAPQRVRSRARLGDRAREFRRRVFRRGRAGA